MIKHTNKCEKGTNDIKAKYLTKSLSYKEMTSSTVKSPELHLSDDEQIITGCYRMYGDSSLVVIGESSFKIGLYFIHELFTNIIYN